MKALFSVRGLENKVVFTAYSGMRYGCNPRAVSEALHEEYPSIGQVWLMKDPDACELPDYVRVVRYGSFSMFRELVTAKVWVDNGTKSLWVRKRKKQFFIQTWHGGLGFKKMGIETALGYGKYDLMRDKHSYAMTDVFLSDSRWTTELYRRILPFYKGEFLECGYPRTDVFYQEAYCTRAYQSVREELGLPENAYLVLYAPTYREDGKDSHYKLDLKRLQTELETKTGRPTVVLVKLHHWSQELAEELYDYTNQLRNLTAFPDMPRLTAAVDCYITDYSSGIFDFAVFRRPAFLYTDDYEQYLEKERGLYFDLRKMPFPFSETGDALIDSILQLDEDAYRRDLNAFLEETGLVETGSSSSQVCALILEKILAKNK